MTRDPLLPVRLVDGVWISAEPSEQKGLHLVLQALPELVASGGQFALLGSGDLSDATEREPGIMTPMTWPAPAEPDLTIPWMPWGYDKTESRQWAKPGAEDGTVEIGGQTFRAVMTWKPKETT